MGLRMQVYTRVYVQEKRLSVTRPRLDSVRLHPWLTSKQFRLQTNSTSAIRWFRSTFFNTTIVAQPEWNHSRLSRDCSLLEELRNSTIGVRHARRSVAGYYFFPKGTALASEACLAQNMPATTATPPRLEPATLPLLDEEQL